MAAKKKAKRYKVIPNPELEQVVKGFRPVFGNEEDRGIAVRYAALNAKLPKVDNEVLRDPKKKKSLTAKMKEIIFEEGVLIHAINRRNMDF